MYEQYLREINSLIRNVEIGALFNVGQYAGTSGRTVWRSKPVRSTAVDRFLSERTGVDSPELSEREAFAKVERRRWRLSGFEPRGRRTARFARGCDFQRFKSGFADDSHRSRRENHGLAGGRPTRAPAEAVSQSRSVESEKLLAWAIRLPRCGRVGVPSSRAPSARRSADPGSPPRRSTARRRSPAATRRGGAW